MVLLTELRQELRGKLDLCVLLFDAGGGARVDDGDGSDNFVEFHQFVRFLNRRMPAPLDAAFVRRALRQCSDWSADVDVDVALPSVSFAHARQLLFPRAAAAAVRAEAAAKAPPPPQGSATVAEIQRFMSECKAAHSYKRDLRRRRAAVRQRRQRHRDAMSRSGFVWHHRLFDATGENGCLYDRFGRKGTHAWDTVSADTDLSANPASSQHPSHAERAKAQKHALERDTTLDWQMWGRGQALPEAPLEMFPDSMIKKIERALARAVAYAEGELKNNRAPAGSTMSDVAKESRCLAAVQHMQDQLTRIRVECRRRRDIVRRKNKERAEAADGAEAAELGGGGSLLPPITTVMSPLTATGPAVTEQWSVPLLVPVKPVLGDEY